MYFISLKSILMLQLSVSFILNPSFSMEIKKQMENFHRISGKILSLQKWWGRELVRLLKEKKRQNK